ncbi:MAG TPA: ATP-binding protein, partial [Candidatus Acidoferrum sp.]|nr:ATP-binding protein [Candidatus Acidoferrum sp.]
ARTYPDAMRENFLWLGAFLREKCSRNLDVLETQIHKLGFKTTGGTISKIITGRWAKDGEGNDTSPIMALNNFNQLVDSLRGDAAISELAGKVPFVETETWEDIKSYIDVRRAPDQVCKFGLIAGPTGSQKTACLKQYVVRNNHGRCHHLEAPDTPTMSKFVTDLGACFGVSVWASTQAKRQRIRENVNEKKTIIIDNIQRLYKTSAGWNQPVFNFLQKLQDDTGCTIILCCVPEWELVRNSGRPDSYFEQFEGRCGGRDEFLVLPDFTPREDLLRIAQAFKLVDAEKHVGVLETITRQRGRIRILFNLLQKAKRRAESEGSKQLRAKHLRAVLETTSLNKLVKEEEA